MGSTGFALWIGLAILWAVVAAAVIVLLPPLEVLWTRSPSDASPAPPQATVENQGWGIRMISGVSAPRFRPFFAHFPPSLARSLRLGARKPDSAEKRRKNGAKRVKNGVETAVYDPYIRMPQP